MALLRKDGRAPRSPPAAQGTLYAVKVFGIISLFERYRVYQRQCARSKMNAVI
jgi:hypothetical protein